MPGIKGLHQRVKIIDGVGITTIAIDHNAAISAAINGADHQGIGIRRTIGIIGQHVAVGGGAFFVDAIRIRDGKGCDVGDGPGKRIRDREAIAVSGGDGEGIDPGASTQVDLAGRLVHSPRDQAGACGQGQAAGQGARGEVKGYQRIAVISTGCEGG